MTTIEPVRPATGRGMLWTGRVLSAIVVLMMAGGGLAMLVHPAPSMAENMTKFGWSDSMSRTILILEVACGVIYAIPQTAVLGAILITGYLGGAVATHLRVGDPGWPAPVVFGIVAWLGLVLRDARLRSVLPLRRV